MPILGKPERRKYAEGGDEFVVKATGHKVSTTKHQTNWSNFYNNWPKIFKKKGKNESTGKNNSKRVK